MNLRNLRRIGSALRQAQETRQQYLIGSSEVPRGGMSADHQIQELRACQSLIAKDAVRVHHDEVEEGGKVREALVTLIAASETYAGTMCYFCYYRVQVVEGTIVIEHEIGCPLRIAKEVLGLTALVDIYPITQEGQSESRYARSGAHSISPSRSGTTPPGGDSVRRQPA